MAAKRKSAKGKTVPRRGRAARASKKPTRKERSEANKRGHRVAMAEVQKELASAPEPEQYVEVTDAIIDDILDRIASGSPGLRAACRANRVCDGTVRRRIREDEQLSTRYAHAKTSQADAWAEDIVEDAEAPVDYAGDGANVEIAHRKHKADVKKWLMGKFHVKQYGDKVTAVLEGNPEKPLETINRTMSQEEQMRLYAEERDKARSS
jgi:hypothetical protein